MVDHLTHVIQVPLGISAVAFDRIAYGAGYLTFFFAQGNQLVGHDWLAVSSGQNIRGLIHHFANLYQQREISTSRWTDWFKKGAF